MECLRSALGLDFDRSRTVAAILRAVIRGQNFELRNRVNAGINVQRAVAAVIHVVAAVQFPVVVLGAAAVHAERNAAVDADLRLILSRLVAYAGDQRDQRSEVAPIQFELSDLFPGDSAGQFGRLRLNLRYVLAFDDHFGGRRADLRGSRQRAPSERHRGLRPSPGIS